MMSFGPVRLVLVGLVAILLIPIGGPAWSQNAGEVYVKERHGDWEVRCISADGPEQCQLYQLLQDQNGNPVAEINVFPLPPGREASAGATLVTPLETLLTKQVRWQVAGHSAKVYPFSFCSAAGCFARVGFIEDDVNQMRAGNTATVTITPVAAPDTTVVLTVSLSGFTRGYDALARIATGSEE